MNGQNVKRISYLEKGTAGFPECRKFFTHCKRWESSVISLTDVVQKTVLAYIWFVRAGRYLKDLLEIIKKAKCISRKSRKI
jgi:hypothetical protein